MSKNNITSDILYMDNKPFEVPKPLEVTPIIGRDFDATMQHLHEQCATATELRSDLLAMTPEDQDALYAASRCLGAAMDKTIEAIAEVFQIFARKVAAAVNAIIDPIVDCLCKNYKHQEELRSVATPRQWHLYLYGKPRVSKKWKHVLEKRLSKQKKEERHRGER